MQLSVSKFGALALLGLLATACTDEGVGDPCIPETIPCTPATETTPKKCGFNLQESYIESSSVQCRSRLCIVHKLDNDSNGTVPADPSKICGPNDDRDTGCVTDEEVGESIFCTCRCGGPETSIEFCDCPDGFACQEVLTLGGEGIRGSYCVKPKKTVEEQ